jgi:hypothetical protein
MPGDVDDIKVEIAALKAQVLNELKHVAHDVKNIIVAQSALVSRREIDDLLARRDDARDALADRVAGLERDRSRAFWAIVTAWLSGLVVAFKVFTSH